MTGALDFDPWGEEAARAAPPSASPGLADLAGLAGLAISTRRESENASAPRPDPDDEAAVMARHYATPAAPVPYQPAAPDRLRDGLRRGALQRPTAWADATALPTRGASCSCCDGARWWREEEAPKGWRCRTCHPPPPGLGVVEVRT